MQGLMGLTHVNMAIMQHVMAIMLGGRRWRLGPAIDVKMLETVNADGRLVDNKTKRDSTKKFCVPALGRQSSTKGGGSHSGIWPLAPGSAAAGLSGAGPLWDLAGVRAK